MFDYNVIKKKNLTPFELVFKVERPKRSFHYQYVIFYKLLYRQNLQEQNVKFEMHAKYFVKANITLIGGVKT